MTRKLAYDQNGAPYPPFILQNDSNEYFSYAATQNFKLSVCRFTPSEDMILHEYMPETDLFRLSFCLGGTMGFSFQEAPGKQLMIERGESCVMSGGTARCISEYEEGREYFGIGVAFHPENLRSISEYFQCENAVYDHNKASGDLTRYIVTPRVEAILSQISDCQMFGSLRNLYYEGKLLELAAVYLDEMVCQRGTDLSHVSLSKEDMLSLHQTKELLEKNYVHPLTIAQLSQKVYLNEYKLKTGFKQLYGQTIYSYVLDKRMELARLLLEQRRFKVSDVAGMVGYANAGHFIAAFSKKYNVTPGELLRNKSHES